jgi:hypothetical protein
VRVLLPQWLKPVLKGLRRRHKCLLHPEGGLQQRPELRYLSERRNTLRMPDTSMAGVGGQPGM